MRCVLWLSLVVIIISACQAREPSAPRQPGGVLAAVSDFVYQLQNEDAAAIGATAFDLVIVSVEIAGNSSRVVLDLKASSGGDKIVLAYMSIGQAEDYRTYWRPEWSRDPPGWLDEEDHDWHGDHWVRYWDAEWQAIIYGEPDSYLDQIMSLGFDGVYLDRVDAYEYYQERDGRESAVKEMANFVRELADYSRDSSPGFIVIPQNAEELGLMFPAYLEAVDGIGVEDLYYGYDQDDTPSPAGWTAEREAILDQWVAAGKLVLTIDYTSRPEQVADVYERSRARGYIPYVTDRDLSRLRINPGYEPG